jgi:hypothetical protein
MVKYAGVHKMVRSVRDAAAEPIESDDEDEGEGEEDEPMLDERRVLRELLQSDHSLAGGGFC